MAPRVSWIAKQLDRCGGEACVRDTRITVWGLVEWRRLGLSDEAILQSIQSIPSLTAADVQAAWAYAVDHPEEIDQAIRENAEA